MIVTLTTNPSLDYHMEIPGCRLGATNRSVRENLRPGGKGINVSVVLNRLGVNHRCLVVTAGFTGEALKNMLSAEGILPEIFEVKQGMTRINVKLDGGSETELNGAGPIVEAKDLLHMEKAMESCKEGDILVLAGSLPKGISADYYAQLARRIREKSGKAVVDSSGEAFRLAVEEKPFLVKPNLAELRDYFGMEISVEEAPYYAQKLQQKTEGYVLLSMGKDGAVLASPSGMWQEKAPSGQAVSATGSGDSMIAGFLAAMTYFVKEKEWLRFAVACGSASAFSPWLARKEEIWSLYQDMNVR